jgi:hypothetical protein
MQNDPEHLAVSLNQAVSELHEVNKMLCRINRGPRFGETVHLPKSQEVQLATLLGDIEVVSDDDNLAQPKPQHPQRGWSMTRVGPELRPALRFDDGNGGYTLYEKPPQPRQEYYFDVEKQQESYRMVESDCPKELTMLLVELTGAADPLAAETAAILRREAIEKQNYETEAQNKLGKRLLATLGQKV